MKHQKHIELSPNLIEELLELFPMKKFKSHSFLFYEGQIPISGYLVIDGSIQISKNKKNKKVLSNGAVIGLSELLKKVPSSISAEVFPNTHLCFLDNSTLQEIIAGQKKLSDELKEIFEIRHE